MIYKRLGDLLISAGLITEEQLVNILKIQKGTNRRLGTVLIENNIITETQLIEALEMQLGLEFVDLSKIKIPPEMGQYLPKNIAKKHDIVPVRNTLDGLVLAMADPLNFVALEDAKAVTRKRIIPVISTTAMVERAIMQLYGNEGAVRAIEEMRREGGGKVDELNFTSSDISEDNQSAAPIIRIVNSVLERAVMERASDIHIEPRESNLRVRLRIDGLLHEILDVPKDMQSAVISRFKILASLDISERKIPQDGRAFVRVKQTEVDLRVSTLPTIYGEKIVIRLLEKSGGLLNAKSIGLNGRNLEQFESLLKNSSGVILIVGPTGSGKSSTMYTMIRQLNTESVNLVTLEDPVEYNIDGVNQVQILEKVGMTFANGLRSILRQDPDIIGLGEIRDTETAEIAMRAAITGHLVLSTIHTNNALSTIDRLIDIGVEPFLVAEALKGILSQRLVRRICQKCKKPHIATEEELEKMQISALTTVYKGQGCAECFNTGYRGRIAVFEILVLNKEIKRMIANKEKRELIEEAVERSGFVSLIGNCKTLVEEGIITIEEAYRVANSTVE